MKQFRWIKAYTVLLMVGIGISLSQTACQSALGPQAPEGPMVNVGPRGGYDAQVEGKDYKAWRERTGLPVHSGYAAAGLETIEVQPWPELGGSAAFLDLSDYRILDAFVYEIPPGGELKPRKHVYEELIVVLSGKGYTRLGNTPEMSQRVDWETDAMFSPPLNTYHQHV
ncbi:MAG: hypothetical protein V3S55_06540, partial [Nitrospiraceae bacterium]